MSMASPEPEEPNFQALVDEARRALADGIAKAGLQRDAYRHPIEGLSKALAVLPPFLRYVEAARQPVRDRELHNAVVAGVRSCSPGILSAFNWRTLALMSGFLAVLIVGSLGVGAIGGWWLFERQNEELLDWGRAAKSACASTAVVNGECHIKLRGS
jgi:hypothetical protein